MTKGPLKHFGPRKARRKERKPSASQQLTAAHTRSFYEVRQLKLLLISILSTHHIITFIDCIVTFNVPFNKV